MGEVVEQVTRDWFDYLTVVISILVPIAVVYFQRMIDDTRQKNDNIPVIALGKFESYGGEFLAGKYFDTDIDIESNKLLKSNIKIPLYNIGKTPISNVSVKFEIKDFDKIRKELPNDPLKFVEPGITEIYSYNDKNDKPIYLIADYEKMSGRQIVKIDGVDKFIDFPNGAAKSISAKGNGFEYLSPMTADSQQMISLNADFELFIQYILFMNSYRLMKENGEQNSVNTVLSSKVYDPIIKFDFKFSDYKGEEKQVTKFMRLYMSRASQKIEIFNTINSTVRTQWQLIPVSDSEINEEEK